MTNDSSSSSRAPLALRALGMVLAAGFAFPAAYLVWRNFDERADPGRLLVSDRTLAPLWRSLRLAAGVSLSAAVLGTALAWITMRTDLPLRRLWRVVLVVPLVFPTFIGAAAFIRTLNPGGLANGLLADVGIEQTPQLKGYFGAWLVLTLFTYPYVYLPVAARLRQLPGSLEESARLLGDTAWRAFRRIVLPQAAGSILAGSLLVFLYTISDFGAVQLMRYDTLTRAIHGNHLARPPVALALSLILLIVAAVVVVAERMWSARLPATGSALSRRPVEYRLGRSRWPVFVGVLAAVGFAVAAPLATLVDWAADGLLRSSRGGRALTIDTDKVMEATTNTLQAGLLTAVVAVLAVLPIAFLVGRYRARTATVAHALVISTFALPGILIALALTYWTRRNGLANDWLAGTMTLLIFAYVVRFGALALGVTVEAVRSVPHQLHDAAATLGAGRRRRFRTIDLPLMAPGLLAAVGLVLLSTMKELPISLLVAPIGFPTLATRIFGSFEDAFVAEAGIMAVVLVGLSSLLSWFLVLRNAEHL